MIEDRKPMELVQHLKTLYPEAFGRGKKEGRSPLLTQILAVWREERIVFDVPEALAEVLYEQANRDTWDFPPSVLAMLPALFYLHTSVDAAQGLSRQEGIFVWRETAENFCLLAAGEDGDEIFHVRFSTGNGATLGECLQHCSDMMRPILARWLEVMMYLASENGEKEEESYYFLLSEGSLPQRVRYIRAGWETGKSIASMKNELERCLAEEADAFRGERKLPRAHIRRPHWHMYRTGSRKKPIEERPLALRWLAPKLIMGKRIRKKGTS